MSKKNVSDLLPHKISARQYQVGAAILLKMKDAPPQSVLTVAEEIPALTTKANYLNSSTITSKVRYVQSPRQQVNNSAASDIADAGTDLTK